MDTPSIKKRRAGHSLDSPRWLLRVTAASLSCLTLATLPSWAQTEPLPPVTTVISPAPDITPLKSGDQVEITVIGFPELSGRQRLTADGAIQLPLAGTIRLGGLTPAQATEQVTIALRPYVRRPQVSVTLLSVRPPRISVTGEVRRPGPHLVVPPDLPEGEFSDLTGGDFQNLSYALVLAGGVTPSADIRNIVIRRQTQPGTAVPTPALAAPVELNVDLWEVIQAGDLEADLRIYDGDEIVVPTAQLSDNEQQTLLTSTVSPTAITVQVAGEVRRPGQVEIAPTANVNTALGAAGGLTNDAKKSISLLRVDDQGQLTQQDLEYGEDSGPLRDGDVILVERKRSVNILSFLGLLLNPLGRLTNVLRLF